jgi:hypothetical protein
MEIAMDEKTSRVLGFLPKQTLLEELEKIDAALMEGEGTPEQEKRGQELVTLADAAPMMLATLDKLSAWLVCAPIASAEDMAQSFPDMLEAVQASIAQATGGAHG